LITGLKVQLTTGQLRDHLNERVAYHRARQHFYVKQGHDLEEAGERPQNLTNDPVKAMQGRAEHHQQRAEAFAVMEKYLIPDEVYVLDSHDLNRLEMASL
jgi:hypothetical protein